MRLIDTNVFIYAGGSPHEYKDSCLALMGQFERREVDVNIDTELLQEILYFFWHRRRPAEGLQMFDRLLVGFPDPVPITLVEMRVARDVFAGRDNLEPRDAIHAAVVLVHGLEGIISTDRGFDAIPGVTRFDPMDL